MAIVLVRPLGADESEEQSAVESHSEPSDQLVETRALIGVVEPRIIEGRLHGMLMAAEPNSNAERDTLIALSEHYRRSGQLAHAAAVMQDLTARFRSDPGLPEWFLELGLIYRDLGTPEAAIARFYQVLDPSLVRGIDSGSYREISQRAQTEIALTYLQQGKFELARTLFDRLLRLDLSDADYEVTLFSLIQCQFHDEEPGDLPMKAEAFLERFPNSDRRAAVRYIQAQTLQRAGRSSEALTVVMALLRETPVESGSNSDPAEATRWQRTGGDFFAKHYFGARDYATALSIYQAMAELSDDPEWLWSVVYQIGVCSEMLGASDRASGAYRWIANEAASSPDNLSIALELIVEGAQWRHDRLTRISEIHTETEKLQRTDSARSAQES